MFFVCRSVGWVAHDAEIYSKIGEASTEAVYSLTEVEKGDLEKLIQVAETESLIIKSMNGRKPPQKQKSRETTKGQSDTKWP